MTPATSNGPAARPRRHPCWRQKRLPDLGSAQFSSFRCYHSADRSFFRSWRHTRQPRLDHRIELPVHRRPDRSYVRQAMSVEAGTNRAYLGLSMISNCLLRRTRVFQEFRLAAGNPPHACLRYLIQAQLPRILFGGCKDLNNIVSLSHESPLRRWGIL